MLEAKNYTVLDNIDIALLKRKDQEKLKLLIKKINELRHFSRKPELQCIVIETNDPDYDTFSHMRKHRIEQETANAAAVADLVD